MINIKDYKSFDLISFRKIYSYTTIILFLLLTFTAILFCYFDYHINITATYIKKSDTLKLVCSENDLQKITDNNELIIKNTIYEYKVRKINKKILDSIPIQQYNEVFISLKLDDKYKLENNSIDVKIKYKRKQVFEIIKDFILGKGE